MVAPTLPFIFFLSLLSLSEYDVHHIEYHRKIKSNSIGISHTWFKFKAYIVLAIWDVCLCYHFPPHPPSPQGQPPPALRHPSGAVLDLLNFRRNNEASRLANGVSERIATAIANALPFEVE